MRDKAVENLASGMASQYDAVLCATLGMSQKEVLALDKGRLSRAIQGDLETVLFDGRPLVTFWPLETRSVVEGSMCKLVSSQKYMIHNDEPK